MVRALVNTTMLKVTSATFYPFVFLSIGKSDVCHCLPGPKNFVFWTGIIFIGEYVSVCVSVCLCVCLCRLYTIYLKKFLTDFWWNLAGWLIMIKDRFLSKMSLISSLERKLQRTRIYTFSYYVPLIIFLWGYFPLLSLERLNAIGFLKKHKYVRPLRAKLSPNIYFRCKSYLRFHLLTCHHQCCHQSLLLLLRNAVSTCQFPSKRHSYIDHN